MAAPLLIAVVGPTATGKSALGVAIAERFNGEVVNCDSTAVYRGFDIGTDKPPASVQRGIPHHLIDIVNPADQYTAARFAMDAAHAIRSITARGCLPVLVGGTGLYYRAVTRGIFPGPARDEALRARLTRLARKRGVERLHRMLNRVDPVAAQRIQPRDGKRLVRAIEVYWLTGRTLTDHFVDTRPPLPDYDVVTVGLRIPAAETAARVARRVDQQFESGLVNEIRGLLERGVPLDAPPFGGLVYRQTIEYLHGLRDEPATRALIVQENRRYARRQLIWFRKEPNLIWFDAAEPRCDLLAAASAVVAARLAGGGCACRPGEHG